jgi:tRNA(Ile2) C34 agmatinyltransferase TiaS
MWISKEYARCPRCGNLLRSIPRNPQSKTRYNGRKYSPADAKQIFERFLSRGYSVEEAVEATFALTGLRPEVKTDA